MNVKITVSQSERVSFALRSSEVNGVSLTKVCCCNFASANFSFRVVFLELISYSRDRWCVPSRSCQSDGHWTSPYSASISSHGWDNCIGITKKPCFGERAGKEPWPVSQEIRDLAHGGAQSSCPVSCQHKYMLAADSDCKMPMLEDWLLEQSIVSIKNMLYLGGEVLIDSLLAALLCFCMRGTESVRLFLHPSLKRVESLN